MLTAQSEIWPLLNELWMDFNDIFRIALQKYKEKYTKILEVNLFAFAYRLFHRDLSPLNGEKYVNFGG